MRNRLASAFANPLVLSTKLLLPLSVLGLSACTLAPDLPDASMHSAEYYDASRTLATPNKISWPDQNWWRRYRDPQLDRLMSEAIADSPNLAAAGARLTLAQGYAQQAGALLAPQAGMNLSATKQKLSYNNGNDFVPRNWNDYGSATLNFSYEFDFWGKNRAAVSAATSDLAAAEAEQRQAHLILTSTLAQAYAELARLYANRDTSVTALQIREQTVKLFRQRFNNGLETRGSVRQVEALQASAEADLLAVDESIALQRNALAALLGKGPDRGLAIERPTVQLASSFGLPSNASIDLLGHRPDITAARWRAEAAASRIGMAQADYYPNINLTAFIGSQSLGLDNLGKSGSDVGGIGPALYLPLFTAGRLDGQLTAAQASYVEAVASYNTTVTQAFHDVADAVTSRQALGLRLQKSRDALQAAEDAYQIANNRYRGGLATYLDVLTAEDALLGSQSALVNLESRAFSLDVALAYALGGGYLTPRS